MVAVSVTMPVHNGRTYLATAIESVLAQTMRDLELVVVDDGSTDGSGGIIRAYAARDRRVRLLSLPRRRGISAARNVALRYCSAEWVACLDADDMMLPVRVERQLAFAAEHPEAAAIGAIALYVNAHGVPFGTTVPVAIRSRADLDAWPQDELIGFNQPSVMMRRSAVLAVGGYDQELDSGEDLDLWSRLVEAGYLVLQQDEILTQYRIHQRSVTHRHARRSHTTSIWVRARACARREGRREPTRAEFDAAWQSRPLLARARDSRHHMGWVYYRRAGAALANRDWPAGVCLLTAAFALRPLHVARRMTQQVLAPRGALPQRAAGVSAFGQ